jgi:MoxR-like ATPase
MSQPTPVADAYSPLDDLKLLRDRQGDPVVKLDGCPGLPDSLHLAGPDELLALQAALVTRRPLLVRGKPGVGKSQLARAAAAILQRALVIQTVDASTETADLLYRVDAVRRLATAQLRRDADSSSPVMPQSNPNAEADAASDVAAASDPLHLMNFVQPGALWWAYDWTTAARLAKKNHGAGCGRWQEGRKDRGVVVLIDEIDKADPSVPNALLDVLANGGFDGPIGQRVYAAAGAAPPLVIITTNEERALPDAFLRRCLVLHLDLPSEPDLLRKFLDARVELHFPQLDATVRDKAVEHLVQARGAALRLERTAPGLAELVDLLRAVSELAATTDEQVALVQDVARLTYFKDPDVPRPKRLPPGENAS